VPAYILFLPNEDRSRGAPARFPLTNQQKDGCRVTEIRTKEIEISLVQIHAASPMTSAYADRYQTLTTETLEPPFKQGPVLRRKHVVAAVTVFDWKRYESVHARTESLTLAFYAANQDAAEFRVRGRPLQARTEFGEHGLRQTGTHT
jgi:hypothetical protein